MADKENGATEVLDCAVFPCSESFISVTRTREAIEEIRRNQVSPGHEIVALSVTATDGNGDFKLTVRWTTRKQAAK